MDSLTDYILWMRDIPFSAVPLGEVDALVLCMLAYFDFSPVFSKSEGQKVRVRDCRKMIEEDRVRLLLVGKAPGCRELLEAAVNSRRFGELEMRHYEDVRRSEPPLQFAAVSFCKDDFTFLAYRGTDNSLAGWEEDFMIGCTVTEAQRLAADYASRRASESRALYIGGHSKGGNLALYAACSLDGSGWEKVQRVFLLDGPGLCPEVTDTDGIRRIDSRTTCILPAFSVVGRLFAPQITDTRIVRSSATGIMQHALFTWGVDHGKLALTEENPISRRLNEGIAGWINGISQADRVIFIRELFDALSADGAETLDEIEANGAGGFEAILQKLLNSSQVTKRTISDLPKRVLLGEHYEDFTQNGLSAWLRGSRTPQEERTDGVESGGEEGRSP